MRFTAMLAVTLGLAAGSVTLQSQSPEQAPALAAQRTWLSLIDASKYGEAWRSAAPAMQHAVSEVNFAKAIGSVREPLGALSARTLSTATSQTQLPGAPDGHYVLAQYNSRFANKAAAVETVVTVQEMDGAWHVSGYYIR